MSFLPKISPEFFTKYPKTVVIILLFTIAGYFVNNWAKSSSDRNTDCNDEKNRLILYYNQQLAIKDSQNAVKDNRLYELQQELLISNGIIDRLPEKLDSISRKKYNHKK